MAFQVRKVYGHNLGLSACFRQWRADSHCRFIHGYALEVEFCFEAPILNDNNWVIDFGSLKEVKQFLVDTFDHKLVVAEDDPAMPLFTDMAQDKGRGGRLADIVILPDVGCEAFAKVIYTQAHSILSAAAASGKLQGGAGNGVFIKYVTVREHGANSATYMPNKLFDLLGNRR